MFLYNDCQSYTVIVSKYILQTLLIVRIITEIVREEEKVLLTLLVITLSSMNT